MRGTGENKKKMFTPPDRKNSTGMTARKPLTLVRVHIYSEIK